MASLSLPTMHDTNRIVTLDDWARALSQPSALAELAVVLACAVLAYGVAAALRRSAGGAHEESITFGRRLIDGVLFPLAWLLFAFVAQELTAKWMPLALFKIALPVLISLAVIRVGVKVLQVAFKNTPVVRMLERTISWVAWLAMVLWVSGLLPVLLDELDQIKWKIGATTLSVRTMLEGALTAGLVMIVTLWISAAIETRLLKNATGSELSLRKAVSNATRALMVFVGLLLALSTVGIDLTALSVLGGAIGVGIGFGLQKLASNYVSGFVILAERSMRIGDFVQVDGFAGRITDINARYTVVTAPNGIESIVPNELLITQRVENWSLNNRNVNQATVISVGYNSDADEVAALLLQTVQQIPRVLKDPGPGVSLNAFGADGLEFRVSYWFNDPENGQGNLRSDINMAILRALRAHNVEIPFPQRVLHVRTGATATAAVVAGSPGEVSEVH